MKKLFDNVYLQGKNLYTRNCYGKTHFSEKTMGEFRQWDPSRSKLAAGIMKNIRNIGIRESSIILYLGSGHGYTPSFISDIIGKKGMVFCLDFSARVLRDLIFICEERTNMAPILCDAKKPETYKSLLPKQVDIVFQDVAQKSQVEIFFKNIDMYLKKKGFALLAVKARSVDVTRRPREIFEEVRKKLKKKMEIIDSKELHPFEKDHILFVCRKN